MKPIENIRTAYYMIPFIIVIAVAIAMLIGSRFGKKQTVYVELPPSESQTINKLENLPLHVKILEPNVTGISFDGIAGEILWLEGSPLSQTDFIHTNYKDFKVTIKKKEILKVPPRAVGYILRGTTSDNEFTVDHYTSEPKIDPDTTLKDISY